MSSNFNPPNRPHEGRLPPTRPNPQPPRPQSPHPPRPTPPRPHPPMPSPPPGPRPKRPNWPQGRPPQRPTICSNVVNEVFSTHKQNTKQYICMGVWRKR